MEEETYYKFEDCKERDVVNIYADRLINIDIDNKFDTLRVCLDNCIIIKEGNLSNFIINAREESKQ